ncbi:xylose isomerase [Bryobacterales bacterium F-183]|nr:xylose isomerase [Bryobacterales bacterium F-183]
MTSTLTRRTLLTAATAAAALAVAKSKVPMGLELYSVRKELAADPASTIKAVAKMGYKGVEFSFAYYDWTEAQTKDIRKMLDDSGLTCWGTHNGAIVFNPTETQKAIDRNRILGGQFLIMASAGKAEGADGWKKVAESLEASLPKLKAANMVPGFHNHAMEFRPLPANGPRPIDIIANNTSKDVVLQLDVGTCVEVGVDPVAWIRKHPGRTRSMHCKDWSKAQGFKAVFGEGDSPWVEIFKAAEQVGGAHHYLIEQEGSAYTPMETAQRCIDNYRKLK